VVRRRERNNVGEIDAKKIWRELMGVEIIAILTKLFAVKNAVKGLIIEPLNKFNAYLDEHDYHDVKELSFFWKQGKIPYGTIVNIEGLFSEFSHTFMPHTYTSYIPVSVSHTMDNAMVGRVGWKSSLFQPPVETLPEVNYDGRRYKLGFIYPHDFSGFMYETKFKNVQEAINQNDSFLHIPESAKPIPIIYRSDETMNTGDIYNLKAKVIELPLDKLSIVTNLFESIIDPIHDRSINLLSPTQKTICLLVDKEPTNFKRKEQYSPDFFPMSFYVEGHISYDKEIENSLNLIESAIPNLADKKAPFNSLSFTDSHVYIKQASDRVGDPSERTAFLTTGEVRILLREPNIIGFYVPIDIDKEIYGARITELSSSIRAFDRNIQRRSNYKAKFHVNFISDKRLISMMNLPRVLDSNEINKVINDNPDFQGTKDWLTNNK
jgi:hypothetical protein